MKRDLLRITLLLFCLLSVLGCSKWLDVKPEDKFVESGLFSTPQGFADAINGLYLRTGSAPLYGENMTMTTMDILAQLYLINTNSPFFTMSQYNYADKASVKSIDALWTNMYSGIANMNKLLESLESQGMVLDDKTRASYKGEVLGLRAYYYFDLMRMFTKNYNTADSVTNVLPYYDKPTYNISAFRPTNFVMQMVLKDLRDAEALLLANDVAVGQNRVSKVTSAFGRDSRNYRMNYYAVKALQARVNLWKGDKAAALAAAKVLIANQNKFPWITPTDLSNAEMSNKIFATEMIFGAENPKLKDTYEKYFSSGVFEGAILAPNQTGTFINTTVFEGAATDYRNQYSWKVQGKTFPTFFKFMDMPQTSINANRTIPMLRMGEMYLIAAECEPDLQQAVAYLNELRTHRNILALPSSISTTELANSIMKEYRKEFYGEGQLFFYYKRTNAISIIAGGTNAALNINLASYTFPIPLSETTPR